MRQTMLAELADILGLVARPHPLRVALDGPSAAGKTTLADELAGVLALRGREVVRASLDGFHNPRSVRHRAGSSSAEGYLRDSFDLDAFISLLLAPLGPGGSRSYREAIYDFRRETPVDIAPKVAPAGAVVLIDGMFLLRPELCSHFDYKIFVSASFDTTKRRAMARDASLFGSPKLVQERYEGRFIPGQTLYIERCRPAKLADVVVYNDEPHAPKLSFATEGFWQEKAR